MNTLFLVTTTFTVKSYSVINILFHRWFCIYVAKRVEYETVNLLSLRWKDIKSLEEQIFCKDYGKMKVSTL